MSLIGAGYHAPPEELCILQSQLSDSDHGGHCHLHDPEPQLPHCPSSFVSGLDLPLCGATSATCNRRPDFQVRLSWDWKSQTLQIFGTLFLCDCSVDSAGRACLF
jgi:hypothetical protein